MKAGDAIDVWIVDHALGQGGMGSVYRCHNRNAPRILAAVKVLDPTLRRSDGAKQRFVREAEILFRLDHPNIVKVRNIRMDGATPYLEMEFVDGIDLENRLATGHFSLPDAIAVIRQLLSALSHIHSKGVQHRDVKPANVIMQSDGKIKLVDFGIAAETDAARLTMGSQAFGSVCYVPPEWGDARIDPVLWDVYSAGLLISEILTGKQAFMVEPGASYQQGVVALLREKQNTPAIELPPRFPEALCDLVREMTRAEPERRMRDLSAAQRVLGDAPLSVPSDARVPREIAPRPPTRSDTDGFLINGGVWDRPFGRRARTLPPAPPAELRARTVIPSPIMREESHDSPTLETGLPTRPEPHRDAPRPWKPSFPGSSPPTGGDPSYATASTKAGAWIEVRWTSPERFRHWASTQLVNYMLVLPEIGTPLPADGSIRVLLSHDALTIDCMATAQATNRAGVCYRLALDALQLESLHRWLAGGPSRTIGRSTSMSRLVH